MCEIGLIGIAVILFLQPLMAAIWIFVVAFLGARLASRKSGKWIDNRMEKAREEAKNLR